MTGQQLEKRSPMVEVCETLASPQFGQKIAQALPAHVTLDRFTRVTLTAVQQTPELISVDRGTLYNAVIRCAQDGLLPDGREAALVIFNDKNAQGGKRASYLPMVGGLRKIAAKHQIAIEAFVVYQNDEFDYQLGYEPAVTHKPPRLDVDRGEPIGAYAVATDQTGRKWLEVMSRSEIESVRKVSRAATSEYGPWVKWWDQMARKTVARRLFKQLPLGDLDERDSAVISAADDEADLGPKSASMSVEEANMSAAITAGVPQTSGPDDTFDAEPEPVDGEIVPDPDDTEAEGGGQGSFFEQQAEKAQRRGRGQQ